MRSLLVNIKDYYIKSKLLKSGRLRVGENTTVSGRKLNLGKGGVVLIGDDSMVDCNICCDRAGATFKIGSRVFIGASLLVAAENITIGDDVLMSWGCTIVDHNSHSLSFPSRANDVADWKRGSKDWSSVVVKPVIISNKAWIGFGVIILKGVTIGEGAVVGAGSVVTKDVAPWTVVAGNPARFIKNIAHE